MCSLGQNLVGCTTTVDTHCEICPILSTSSNMEFASPGSCITRCKAFYYYSNVIIPNGCKPCNTAVACPAGKVISTQCASVAERLTTPTCVNCPAVPNSFFTVYGACDFLCNIGYMLNNSVCIHCNSSMCDVGQTVDCYSSNLHCNECQSLPETSRKQYICRGDCSSRCIGCKSGSSMVNGLCISNSNVPDSTPVPVDTGRVSNVSVVYPQRQMTHSGDSSTPWFIG